MRHYSILVTATVLLLPLGNTCFGQWSCSTDTVSGTWTYQGHGTVMMNLSGGTNPAAVPVAGLGIATIDYQGRYTLHATISIGGQVQDMDFAGSIQVSPDCTAKVTYTAGSLPPGADRLVILDHGDLMEAMPTQFPLGPFAGMFYLRRIKPYEAQCGDYMVRGAYAGPREGIQMMPVAGQPQPVAVPFSAVHTANFQGDGTGTAASTASMGGMIVDFEFSRVSIAVNPDCTATMKYSGTSKQFPGQTFTGAVKYIVFNHGSELIGMDTAANTGLPGVVLDNLKRISMSR